MIDLDSILNSRDIILPTKVCIFKAVVFPLVIYGCESWTVKKAEHQRIDAFELWCWRRLLRVLWTAKEFQPVNPKGNQSWIFIGRTDAEAEVPILRPPDARSQLIGKDLDAGKDWGQEEEGMTEDEMVGWHHWLDGREFEQTPGNGEGQGSLACCSPWGHKELDTTEWLNSNKSPWKGKIPKQIAGHSPVQFQWEQLNFKGVGPNAKCVSAHRKDKAFNTESYLLEAVSVSICWGGSPGSSSSILCLEIDSNHQLCSLGTL